MAKGDFIFNGVDTTSYTSDQLASGRHEPGTTTAGLTLCFLDVTVEWTKGVPADAVPKTGGNQGEKKGQKKGDGEPGCACKAKITDYSLQVNAYVGSNVTPGNPQALVEGHELYHVREKRKEWNAHKTELDTLLDAKEYACNDDQARALALQDILQWFQKTFFSRDGETGARVVEDAIKDAVDKGKKTAAQALDAIFGKDRLKENGGAAKKDADLPIKDRFTSVVLPTWKGSCQK